jgi:flagellar motor switch protein FliM
MSSISQALSQDEIDNLLSSLDDGHQDPFQGKGGDAFHEGDAGGLLGGKRSYKLYNFRRPDKFSKDHLRALQTIHDSFARQLAMLLTAYLRMNIEIDVVSVDQLTYDEFVRSMPSPLTVAIIEMAPLSGQSLLGYSHEIASSIIDRMLGGPGLSESEPRELTDIELSLMKRIIDRTVETLEEAWHSFISVSTSIIGIEESYNLIQVASPGEIVALVTFEITLSNRDSGLMSLCIPYPVLEMVLGQLSAQHIFHRQNETAPVEEKDKILSKLHYAKLPVEVFLGGTRLSIQELLELSVGDVVKLERSTTSDLLVNINHCPKFYGRPGRIKDKLAIYVTETIENEETIEGFGRHG